MRWDEMWSRARADLVVTNARGEEDVFLWEHSSRVAQNVRQILALPDVDASGVSEVAVVAAALYHESGWIVRLKRGEIDRYEILVRSAGEDHQEESAVMLEQCMSKLLPSETLTRAHQAIRAMGVKRADRVDAMVLMDADHLDEFGVISLWTTVRRGMLDGKGIQAVIETWRRRKEYRFWEARLRDSFHFEAVRAVAKRRLDQLDNVMQELEEQYRAGDLAPKRLHDKAASVQAG